MANRKPLVYIAGEAREKGSDDILDLGIARVDDIVDDGGNLDLEDDSDLIPNTHWIQELINYLINEGGFQALVFKGVVNSNSDLPASHQAGWVYVVNTPGTYVGQTCEKWDTIVCTTDGTSQNNNHWYVIQGDMNRAVSGPDSATINNLASYSKANGKEIKDSGISTSAVNNAFSDITNLKGRMTTAEGDITNLKSRVTNTENNITTINNNIDTLSDNVLTKDMITGEDGIIYDAEKNILAVDFDSMPTSKFEDLMKQADIPIYIDGVRISNQFYVDPAIGVDSVGQDTDKYVATRTKSGKNWGAWTFDHIFDGQETLPANTKTIQYELKSRGACPQLPWKTLTYAVEQIGSKYNINKQTVYINIVNSTNAAAVTYTVAGTNKIALGEFQRTTGKIVIRPYNNAVVILKKTGYSGPTVEASGGVWTLQNLTVEYAVDAPSTRTDKWYWPGCVVAKNDGTILELDHCHIIYKDINVTQFAVSENSNSAKLRNYIILSQADARLRLMNGTDVETYRSANNNTSYYIFLADSGKLTLYSDTTEADATYNLNCTSENGINNVTTVAVATKGGTISYSLSSNDTETARITHLASDGVTELTITGKQYYANYGSSIEVPSGTINTFFPGSTSGTTDSTSYITDGTVVD